MTDQATEWRVWHCMRPVEVHKAERWSHPFRSFPTKEEALAWKEALKGRKPDLGELMSRGRQNPTK